MSSLGSAFSGGRLRRLILLRFCSRLLGGSFFLRSRLSSRTSVPRPGVPLLSPWSFSVWLLSAFGAFFFLVPSFSSWDFFYPCILFGSVLCFLGHLFLFGLLNFLSLYFLIFFYLFLFISICPSKGLRKGRVGVGTLSSGGCGRWERPWGKHYFNPTLPYFPMKDYRSNK